jgi:hypothetical protein
VVCAVRRPEIRLFRRFGEVRPAGFDCAVTDGTGYGLFVRRVLPYLFFARVLGAALDSASFFMREPAQILTMQTNGERYDFDKKSFTDDRCGLLRASECLGD